MSAIAHGPKRAGSARGEGAAAVQASGEQLRELQVQLPRLEGEAAAAAAEMSAAQLQAQHAGVTDEEREQLMERIPLLTNAESDLTQRLATVRGVLLYLPGLGRVSADSWNATTAVCS